jgi:phosphoglycolate phosphatase
VALEFVLFDLDGVLVDSRQPISASINHALLCEGLPPEPAAELHRFFGPPLDSTFRILLASRGADPERAGACVDHYRERYATLSLEATSLFPGVTELLQRLPADLRIGVATSKPAAFARPILEALDAAKHFEAIVGPPLEGSHRETKAETVARARRAIGADVLAGAMVGDRAVDVEAGRANGLVTVAVTWGIGEAAELDQAAADVRVSDPAALGAWIAGATSGAGA